MVHKKNIETLEERIVHEQSNKRKGNKRKGNKRNGNNNSRHDGRIGQPAFPNIRRTCI